MPMIIHLEKSMVKMAALVLFGFISTIRLNIVEKMRQHIASIVTCLVKKVENLLRMAGIIGIFFRKGA